VHGALILAEHDKIGPVSTGWILRQVYLGLGGRKTKALGADAKLEHWMYKEVRRACETYAVRFARGISDRRARGSTRLRAMVRDVSK
jgi:hypothetical protein